MSRQNWGEAGGIGKPLRTSSKRCSYRREAPDYLHQAAGAPSGERDILVSNRGFGYGLEYPFLEGFYDGLRLGVDV